MTALETAALGLVTYPWQKIPGYSIRFAPSSQAPAGVYGETVFSWGWAGGHSTIYVYPHETAAQMAGVIAFEIGHEVDGAGVYPAGGHDAIKNLLGLHPANWMPPCDCDEHNYLSGWYSMAFANRWSPGVGAHWSHLSGTPTGKMAASMAKWLNPKIVIEPPVVYDL